jgi:PAS domain S-box-containing protein
MGKGTLALQIEAALQSLTGLKQRCGYPHDAGDSQASSTLQQTRLVEDLEELTNVMEELKVAATALQARNKILEAESRHYQDLVVCAPVDKLVTDTENLIEQDITERLRVKKILRERTYELGERVKELNCLFSISELIEKPEVSLEEVLKGTTELIPPAWQYPEITCAQIILEDRVYKTDNFKDTIWKQSSDILVNGERVGIVDVCYLEIRPENDDGPFLKEERSLIQAIAERLGRIVEQIWTHEALRKSEALNRAILEAIPDMLFQIRQDGTVQRFEPAKDIGLPMPPGEFLGKKISEVMPSDNARQSMRCVELTLETEKMQVFEYQLEINKEMHDYEARYVPCGQDEVLSVVRDITERKQSEAEKARLFESINEQRDQLRALTGRLADTREGERKALARELHDQVGQNLTALNLNLNIIRAQLPDVTSTTTDPIQTLLDDSLVLLEQTTERVQNVMANLRPPVLDDYGLVEALRWYGAQLAARVRFTITVVGKEPVPRLTSSVENALFRITQEALTNVTKHAQARQVTVMVETDNGTVRLIVTDDGLGFDSASRANSTRRRSWGLITMAERTEAIGGRFRIESGSGQGTKVIVEVPQ